MNIIAKLSVFLSFIICLVIIAILMLYGYYNQQINSPIVVQDSSTIIFTIERGMSTDEIAQLLHDKNIISDPNILKLYKILNPDQQIQAGYYEINFEDKNFLDVLEDLKTGSFEKKLTFVEGWRLEEYSSYLKKRFDNEYSDRFINSKFTKEGFMFPDTYIIEENYSPENLASWMRNTFDKKVTQEMKDQAGLKGLSIDQVVILASIVEREMNIKKERPVVAGILIKRLNNGWPIQADATLQYAKGTQKDWWPIVTRADYKELLSPYNTYLNKGLPPTPICNPSIDSINAVINYKETPYWFYINDMSGNTYYAETLDEHNANISKHLK